MAHRFGTPISPPPPLTLAFCPCGTVLNYPTHGHLPIFWAICRSYAATPPPKILNPTGGGGAPPPPLHHPAKYLENYPSIFEKISVFSF